jgi:hypothetical protein
MFRFVLKSTFVMSYYFNRHHNDKVAYQRLKKSYALSIKEGFRQSGEFGLP